MIFIRTWPTALQHVQTARPGVSPRRLRPSLVAQRHTPLLFIPRPAGFRARAVRPCLLARASTVAGLSKLTRRRPACGGGRPPPTNHKTPAGRPGSFFKLVFGGAVKKKNFFAYFFGSPPRGYNI